MAGFPPPASEYEHSASDYPGATKTTLRNTVDPDSPSHPDNGDYDRTRWADTARDGSTRVTRAQAEFSMDFRSQSQGEECGSPIDVPDPFGMGTVRVNRTPDPWSTNRPIGGAPDPMVGRPRP